MTHASARDSPRKKKCCSGSHLALLAVLCQGDCLRVRAPWQAGTAKHSPLGGQDVGFATRVRKSNIPVAAGGEPSGTESLLPLLCEVVRTYGTFRGRFG